MDAGKVINQISVRLRRRSNMTGRQLGVTQAQGRVLEFILVESVHRQLCQKDIEREFDLRPSTVTELLKNLEERGMIQRISSERDGRYRWIQFTEAAGDIRLELQKQIQKTEAQMIRGISSGDMETFMKVAGKMLENLGE